jgi:fucose 4-O-acetylase-like acetyltransferase
MASRTHLDRAPRLVDFSDAWRIIAMVGIVLVHSRAHGGSWSAADHVVNQIGRFATPMFFMVSGYLWAYGGGASRPGNYLGRRLESLLVPYLFWFAVTFVGMRGVDYIAAGQVGDVWGDLYEVLFMSLFWFIPQLLLTLYVVGVAYRRFGATVVGLGALVITLLYAVNFYVGAVHVMHSEAPLAFALAAWLGMVLYDREDEVQSWLDRIPMGALLAAVVVTFAIALADALNLGIGDTMRGANQVYSLAVIAALLKYSYGRRWVYRERTVGRTYGIYLMHLLVLVVGFKFLEVGFSLNVMSDFHPNWWQSVISRIAVTAFAWFGSEAAIRALHKARLGRLAGAPPIKRRRSPVPVGQRGGAEESSLSQR